MWTLVPEHMRDMTSCMLSVPAMAGLPEEHVYKRMYNSTAYLKPTLMSIWYQLNGIWLAHWDLCNKRTYLRLLVCYISWYQITITKISFHRKYAVYVLYSDLQPTHFRKNIRLKKKAKKKLVVRECDNIPRSKWLGWITSFSGICH